MTAERGGRLSPSAPVEVLEPWIAARLLPLPGDDRAVTPHRPDDELQGDEIQGDELQGDELRPAFAITSAAAVLVPLVEREAGLSVLLTRRADTLSRHSGQVAFPGGRCDPGETVVEAALREAEEEIGLERRFVRTVGLSDPYVTVTGFRVTPVVGFVRPGFTLTPSPAEVAEVFETPLAFLMDAANHERRSHQASDGAVRRYYAMTHGERLIWGATAGMLRGLYERLFASAPD